jgi:hypothetical protein
MKGVIAVGNQVYYEGDEGYFPPGKPHHYRNLTNSDAELFLLFSPYYDSKDREDIEIKEEELEIPELASFMLSRTDIPLYGTNEARELKYALFLEKEYGERGPIMMMDEFMEGKDLEPIIIDEATGEFSSPRHPEKDSKTLKQEIRYTNSVFYAGSLQSSYAYSIYQWFDKIPKMLALYSTPEVMEHIKTTEFAGDYLIRLRRFKELCGLTDEQPINAVFVETKNPRHNHLTHKDRILERCNERGIPVAHNVTYREGDTDFSYEANGSTAFLVECLDRISLVRDIQDRFGTDARIVFRAFNPMVLSYYRNSRPS